MNNITIEELKDIFKRSVDESENMNEAIERAIQYIYLRGLGDGLRRRMDLPENATNGDVFKALFPNYIYVGTCVLDKNECILLHDVNYHWWNAPYNVEREDEDV